MRSSRFTIGEVMMGIAVFASLLAVPRLAVSPERIVMVCLVGLLTVLVVLNHQPHPSTRRQRLDDAERKARTALNHLRDLRE
jgi:hypothetical protein